MLSITQLNLLKELAIKNRESKYKALQEALVQKEQHTQMLDSITKQLDLSSVHYSSGQLFKKHDFELQQFNRQKLENTLHQLNAYTLGINQIITQQQKELQSALSNEKKWDILIKQERERLNKKSARVEQVATDEFNTIRRGRLM